MILEAPRRLPASALAAAFTRMSGRCHRPSAGRPAFRRAAAVACPSRAGFEGFQGLPADFPGGRSRRGRRSNHPTSRRPSRRACPEPVDVMLRRTVGVRVTGVPALHRIPALVLSEPVLRFLKHIRRIFWAAEAAGPVADVSKSLVSEERRRRRRVSKDASAGASAPGRPCAAACGRKARKNALPYQSASRVPIPSSSSPRLRPPRPTRRQAPALLRLWPEPKYGYHDFCFFASCGDCGPRPRSACRKSARPSLAAPGGGDTWRWVFAAIKILRQCEIQLKP